MGQNEFQRQIVVTNDGSTSIYIKELDEHYHSTHGAIQEARHVFIDMGLNLFTTEPIEILEVGFGTGLNCLLTALQQKKINYHGIEAYPVDSNLIGQLNYTDDIPNSGDVFRSIHELPWQDYEAVLPEFNLLKDEVKLEDVVLEQKYQLIYFDAFGPRAQEELWDIDLFRKLFDCLVIGGVFVTYCAKGQVRRDLQSVGFEVERLPGPPGKREMLRGIKN